MRKAKNTTPSIPGGESRGVEELEKSQEHHIINPLGETAEVLESLRKAKNEEHHTINHLEETAEVLRSLRKAKNEEHHTINHLGERAEVLRSLRKAKNEEHTINRLEERRIERGSAWHSTLRGRDRAHVHQILELSETTLGQVL